MPIETTPAENLPTGRHVFITPLVNVPQAGYQSTSLNLDTVIEPDAAAHVTVRVPSDAELWFGGTKLASDGTVRVFNSPALKPGKLYDYEVKVSWRQDGRPVTRT
jgi:uncharacterized protein (TIGR03000 family)